MDYYYRVLVEYEGNIYAWRGEALHDRQARAIARSQVGRYFDLPKGHNLPVIGWSHCHDREPDPIHPDIRVMLKGETNRNYTSNHGRVQVDLIQFYNFRVAGITTIRGN